MREGVMYLVDIDDKVVKYRSYNSSKVIKNTIETWSKLIGPSFSRMYIHFLPKELDDFFVGIKREKGVYDNTGYIKLTQEHT